MTAHSSPIQVPLDRSAGERPLTWMTAAMLTTLTVAIVGLWLDPQVIGGAPAWLKPAKFALSAALYGWTLVLVLRHLGGWPRVRRAIAWTTTVVFVLEVALVVVQAARGTTSHFNVGTPLDAAIFGVMGFAIFAQTAVQPQVEGWDVWLYTQPANDVGGDLVDHLPLDDGRHAVALGDVTGKALPAALLAVKLQATIRALAPRFEDLGEFASAMNSILYRDGLPTRFASLVYLVLTPDDGHVRYLNAGHMPPFVMRNGAVTTLPNGSMVIGMMPGVPFVEQQTTLEAGDTLYAYSDGVSEALDESGDFFGDDRLQALVLETRGMPVAEAGQFILRRLEAFVGTAEQSDDVSLMILRRR